ncbi:MAG: hypothetical protein HC808_10135 [Candidatus Competibacteraceae bacterium]|nr:hypothetical protein [Candidatus Competibacteraceae bacterium]
MTTLNPALGLPLFVAAEGSKRAASALRRKDIQSALDTVRTGGPLN